MNTVYTAVISWVISYTFHLLFRLIPLKKKNNNNNQTIRNRQRFRTALKTYKRKHVEKPRVRRQFFLGEKSPGVVFLTIMNVIIMFFRRRQTPRQIWCI